MATSVVGVTSQPRQRAYITPDMFKYHGRRGVEVSNLVPKGSAAEQDAALLAKIEAGSAWCDSIIGPAMMGATYDTVQENVNVSRRGYVSISPRYRPVIGVTSFAIGPSADLLRELPSLDGIDVQEDHFKVPVVGGRLTSSEGPLEFGGVAAPWDQALVRYTYVNGFAVASLTAAPAQGAVQIEVDDTTGIVAGRTWMTIYALQNRHQFLVTSVSTADAGGLGSGPGTIGCSALQSAIEVSDPLYPPLVSAMPPQAIEAVVLATRAMIKESGGGGGAGSSTARPGRSSGGGGGRSAPSAGDDFAAAEAILRKLFVLDS